MASVPIALVGEGTSSLLPRILGWSVLGACLVVLGPSLPASWRELAPLRALRPLGVVSFCFYLVNQPIQLLLAQPVKDLGLGITGTLAVAYLSFRLFERPFPDSGGM